MLLALCTGIGLTELGRLQVLDVATFDGYHLLLGKRKEPKATLIASMDAESLDLYPNTPLLFWGPHFAKAIQRLIDAGASCVALDFYLSITPEQWMRTLGDQSAIPESLLDYDQTFDSVLSTGRVVLAAGPIRQQKAVSVPMPAREYLEALPDGMGGIGLSNFLRDNDDRVRRLVPAYTGMQASAGANAQAVPQALRPPDPWWTLSALAIKKSVDDTAWGAQGGTTPYAPMVITYCGPPGTIPRLSLAALLREQELTPEEESLVRGRVVFIGADFESFGDRQPTPYSKTLFGLGQRDMSSIEIHANIAETLLDSDRLRQVPLLVAACIWLPFMLLSAYASMHYSTLKITGAIDIALSLVMWLIGFAFFMKGALLPQAGLYAAIGAFFTCEKVMRLVDDAETLQKATSVLDKRDSTRWLARVLSAVSGVGKNT